MQPLVPAARVLGGRVGLSGLRGGARTRRRDDADEAAKLRDEVDVLKSQASEGTRAGREAAMLREQLEASKQVATGAE